MDDNLPDVMAALDISGQNTDELDDILSVGLAALDISGQITVIESDPLNTSLRKMRGYDTAIERGPKTQVSLDEPNLCGEVVLYHFETSGFSRSEEQLDDILQVAAIRMNLANGVILGRFNEFVQPTKNIPVRASRANGLFFENNRLFKRKPDGTEKFLETVPSETALKSFVDWVFLLNGSQEREQVLLIGYNNHTFDDHFLLHHCKKKLESEKFMLLRRKLFTSDLKNVTKPKKKPMVELLKQCNGSQALIDSLHDALQDCEAMAHIINFKQLTISNFIENARSFESVYDRCTDPLLKAKLITETVAAKMKEQMSCKTYLAMSDEEVRTFLRSLNVATRSLNVCLSNSKRKVYVDFLKQPDNLSDDMRSYYCGQSS